MRRISLGLIFLSIVACGKKATKTAEDDSTDRSGTDVAIPAIDVGGFTLRASRDYNPDIWESGQATSPVKGRFWIPEKLRLVSGNAGRAWASLVVGTRKFCYKGNASWFQLISEKLRVDAFCDSSKDSMPYDQNIVIGFRDKLTLDIAGGKCGFHCHYTEVEAVIEVRQN